MNICVFGAASDKIDEKYIKIVENLGEILAKRGHNLVFGAGGSGLMGAAARGCKKGGGKIINVCSMMSELGRETVSAYASAKGGLKMLTKNIASEFGEYNIQCNGIGPGYIATSQTAPLRERGADGSRHPFDSFIVSKTPAGRWGDPEDLAGPTVFLASSASDFVNGHILYVDGGILAYIGKQPK
jgi:gluconate 5-dehydrogenase